MLEVLQTEIDRLEAKIKPLKEAVQNGTSKNKERDKANIEFFSKQLKPKKKELEQLTARLKQNSDRKDKTPPPQGDSKKPEDTNKKDDPKTNKLPGVQ